MTGRGHPARSWASSAAILVAALLVCGPLLASRGFALVGDMTFVPIQPFKAAWLGLDGSAPRAVPADALVSLFTQVIPGDLLQKAILLGALTAAGIGMTRMVRTTLGVGSRTAALAAGVLYLWNPFVHERLAIGHWGLLIGYAALPWVVPAAVGLRRGVPGAVAGLTLAAGAAAAGSPAGGLMAGLVAAVFVVGPGGRGALRRTGLAVAVVLLVNLPWLVPGLTGAEGSADRAGVTAFTARSDTPLGVWGSLLTLGGIWKRNVVPGERDALLLVLIALAVTVAALVGLVHLGRRRTLPKVVEDAPGDARRLLGLAVAGLLLAGLPATGIGADTVAALVEHVPGAGLLRDSQKWAALLALPVAAGFGVASAALLPRGAARGVPPRILGVALVALPVVVLPSMAWGLAGRLAPVQYPSEWTSVRKVYDSLPADQRRTVVLPFSAYQLLPWNDGRAALDPAIRFFPGQTVTNDELAVSAELVVSGDDPDAAVIGAAVRRGGDLIPVLARTGVRYVLVEKTAAGAANVVEPGGRVLHDGAELRLIDTGNPARLGRAENPAAILVGDALAVLTVLLAGGFLVLRSIRHKSPGVR